MRDTITVRQRRAAKKTKEVIDKNLPMDGKAILVSSGYSDSIAKNPKVVFESEGFKMALEDLGFSVKAADMMMAKILRTGKEENQIRAGQEIYKRLGAYEQGGEGTTNIIFLPLELMEKHKLVNSEDATDASPITNS